MSVKDLPVLPPVGGEPCPQGMKMKDAENYHDPWFFRLSLEEQERLLERLGLTEAPFLKPG